MRSMHNDVMIRGLGSLDAVTAQKMAASNIGAPTHTGPVIGGVVPTAQPTVLPVPQGLATFARENPIVAGGAILGGAYLAYKAGSLLGGLLAGGAALLYGSHILAGLSGEAAAASKAVAEPAVPVIPDAFAAQPVKTEADLASECASAGGVWSFEPMSCNCFGCECPQHRCLYRGKTQSDPGTDDPGWLDRMADGIVGGSGAHLMD